MKDIFKILIISILCMSFFSGCQPEMPVTSSIVVDFEGYSVPVNKQLYGLTIEEINHAVDGGIYAEMIRNRSFEEGVPPLNCPYDPRRNVLITPNGWTIPFVRPDSIPGWRRISGNTYIWPDMKEVINDKNRRSLFVSASATAATGKGGVIATGYNGLSLRKGEKYELSLYLKSASMNPKKLSIFLSDSMLHAPFSEVFNVAPQYEWRKYKHTFTATETTNEAVLAITADTSIVFWMDMVSLFPQKTWKGRPNGLRPDLMEMIASLKPQFIRFPGGSFVEGYTAGTFPVWHETTGDISQRKNFWNVWGYGSTNGMGYHEFLQMCEDLDAEPLYVVNSGVTSQSRRPRYEDITAMDKLVQDALNAIAYANHPTDSVFGAMRAANGHPEPFGLKYIEIGSENYGQEYSKRFELFKKAIGEAYPDITVIKSAFIQGRNRAEWTDYHFYSGEKFLIANHNRYEPEQYLRRFPAVFVGEFSMGDASLQGTMRAAVSEACFLLGVENSPEVVRGLAYAPVLGNAGYGFQRYPAIAFDNANAVGSPSYHMLKMLADHRGDELLKTEVDTYGKPQVAFGYAAIELFDNSYDFEDVRIDGRSVADILVRTGGWKAAGNGTLVADANRWNYVLMGDSTAHDYTLSMKVRRNKGSGLLQIRVRDNGKPGEANDHIAMALSPSACEFYHSAGTVKDTLCSPKPYTFESNRWYEVKVVCKDERIKCYVDGLLIHEVTLPPLPSLVSVATLEKETNTILLKVVNTTQHEEKTELNIKGIGVKNEAEVIQLAGDPMARNTFAQPERVAPVSKNIAFSLGGPMVYAFPPNSITILKLKID